MANIRPPSAFFLLLLSLVVAAVFFRLLSGGTNKVTCPPLAINPRTTPSSIRVATTSMHEPGTSVDLTLESNRPPSVMTHPGSATTTYAPSGTGEAPDEPVSALSKLIHPLVNFITRLAFLFPPPLFILDSPSSSFCGKLGTMTRALTRSPFTWVCTTSTHRPRSSLPITVESRSGVLRRGRPPPKFIRYTPRGTGSVQGPESSSVTRPSILVLPDPFLPLPIPRSDPPTPLPLSPSSSSFSSFSSSLLAHCKLIHPSYLTI
mmetsp:Transcript_12394/g.22116  ORF Transcript_12394/g.22116 Transcript_12394/m.22116 type:complete len:262 (-) Transcript_12394:1512-2297(-)